MLVTDDSHQATDALVDLTPIPSDLTTSPGPGVLTLAVRPL
jgi:hypothetical protein